MIYAQIHRHTLTRFHIERTHMIRTTTDNRRTRLRRQCNQHEMTNGSGTNVKMRQHKKRYTHTNTKRNSRAARVECFWLQIQRRRHRFDMCLCENDDDGVEDEVYGDEKSNESMNWVEHFSHFFFRISSNELVFEAQSNARNRKYCVTSMQWTLTK